VESEPLREAETAYKRMLAELASDGRAFFTAFRAVRDQVVAEDAVQEAFCQLLRRPHAEWSPERLRAYFLQAVRGNAVSLARKRSRRKRGEENYVRSSGWHVSASEDRVEREMAARDIRDAIDGLPREEREAVSLCYELDLTERVAASVLSVPQSTLNRRVRRGLARMRQTLSARGYAAAAPAALARQVRDLGVPPQPEALKNRLLDLLEKGTSQHPSGTAARCASKSGTGRAALWPFAVGAAVLAALVVAALWAPDASNNEDGTVTAGDLAAKTDRSRAERGDGRVLFEDDFEQGLGKWAFEARRSAGVPWELCHPSPEGFAMVRRVEGAGRTGAFLVLMSGDLRRGGAVAATPRGLGRMERSCEFSYDLLVGGRAGARIFDSRIPSVVYRCNRWYRVRREHVRLADGDGRGRWRERVFLDGRLRGVRYLRKSPTIGFRLDRGACPRQRIDNVIVRECVANPRDRQDQAVFSEER
jgi:RNA polymerase sigma-70 factor (ECF subfamily)